MGLKPILVASGVQIFVATGAHFMTFSGDRGVLIGMPFLNDGNYPALRPTDLPTVSTRLPAQWLARNIWGPYVALWIDRERGHLTICRDPGGMQPCYVTGEPGAWIVGSDAGDLLAAAEHPVEIDWAALSAHMILPDRRLERTGLAGIKEVLAGDCLRLGDVVPRRFALWSPDPLLKASEMIKCEREAIERVRDETLRVVGACGRSASKMLLGLSGGLDSSIVAACLAYHQMDFAALTISTRARSGDEREYARIVAQHLGVDLIEREERPDFVDLLRSESASLPRPVSRAFAQSGDRISTETAREIGADAFISGGGGDNVYCSLQSVIPFADRYLSEGVGFGLFATARDMAAIADCRTMTVIRRGLRRAYRRPRAYRWTGSELFMSERARHLAIWEEHPWQISSATRLPGQSNHVVWLLGAQNHLEGYGRERAFPMLFPLLAQPLVEACLRIPTWLWCGGGRNRSIARHAFADMLPVSILSRRAKGSPDSLLADIVDLRRSEIREILGDGILRREELIDFVAIDEVLRVRSLLDSVVAIRMMLMLDVEAWLRAWTARDPQSSLAGA